MSQFVINDQLYTEIYESEKRAGCYLSDGGGPVRCVDCDLRAACPADGEE